MSGIGPTPEQEPDSVSGIACDVHQQRHAWSAARPRVAANKD
jgi:hypothetical protein